MLSLSVDPRPVAIARIGLGLAGMINVLELTLVLYRLAAGTMAVPFFDWAPPITSGVVFGFMIVGVVSTIAIISGIAPSAGAVTYVLATATVLLWDQQTYSSHQWLSVLMIAYLAFARSDRAYSFVRRTGPRRPVPWWPQLLMMTQLSTVYLFAGFAKLNMVYLSGDPLAEWLVVTLPDWVYPPLAMASAMTELLVLAIGLWVPKFRLLAVIAGVCLHLSIIATIPGAAPLTAFALACVPLYPLYLTRPSLKDLAGHRVPLKETARA